MIIIFCDDDQTLVDLAFREIEENEEVFFRCILYNDPKLPRLKLGKNENLFISAHGSDTSAIIGGHGAKSLSLTSRQLWNHIRHLFPVNYEGAIYLASCYAADELPPKTGNSTNEKSFITQLSEVSGQTVYGQSGGQPLEFIPHPDEEDLDYQWTKG